MAISFFLSKRPEYPESRPVSVVVSVRRHRKHRLWVSTPIRLAPRDWSEAHERLKPSVPGAPELNVALEQLKAHATLLLVQGNTDAEIRAALKVRLGTAAPEAAPLPVRLVDLYDGFLQHKQARVRASTAQVYEALRGHLRTFAGDDGAERVTRDFLDEFALHLTRAGLSNSTVNKLLTRTKGFLGYLLRRGDIERCPDVKPLPTARNGTIYASAAELQALVGLDLSSYAPGHQAARDLFVAGAVTGQRFGDLQEMTWAQLDLARRTWSVPTGKTSVTLSVPLAAPLLRILEAHRGNPTPLPRLSNQKTNAYLKEVCRLAGIDAPVTTQVLRGGTREAKTRPKWEVMTTHAARRTFVTLMLQGGAPMNELLGFTHDDLRTLRQYAGQSEEGRRAFVSRTFDEL